MGGCSLAVEQGGKERKEGSRGRWPVGAKRRGGGRGTQARNQGHRPMRER